MADHDVALEDYMIRTQQFTRNATCLAVALAAVALGMSDNVAAQARGHLYASVLQSDGTPVVDLTVDAFELSMDENELTVVDATLQSEPMKIALMVDNGNAMNEANADTALREGLAAFLDTLDPVHEVAVFTLSGNVQRRQDFTTDRDELRQATGEIFAEGGSPRMMDGLFETWDRRFDDDDAWPVMLMVLSDGAEGSGYVGEDKYNEFVDDLRAREATIHILLLAARGQEGREGTQIQYGMNLTQNTGGIFETIAAATGLTEQLTRFANRLNTHFELVSTRYRVTYEVPDGVEGGGISVSVNRGEVNLQLFADRSVPQ